MNGLAFGTAFAGAAILLWAVRALRSRVVTFGKLRLYGRWSVWIFGFVSTICGFLMALTGAAGAVPKAASGNKKAEGARGLF